MNPKVENIIRECAAKHGVSAASICNKYIRPLSVARARHEAFYRIRNELMPLAVDPRAYSYPAIGQMFDGMDHSTVIHGVKRHAERLGQ
jgi:chromosomal replication initiation ATPase DnaA